MRVKKRFRARNDEQTRRKSSLGAISGLFGPKERKAVEAIENLILTHLRLPDFMALDQTSKDSKRAVIRYLSTTKSLNVDLNDSNPFPVTILSAHKLVLKHCTALRELNSFETQDCLRLRASGLVGGSFLEVAEA